MKPKRVKQVEHLWTVKVKKVETEYRLLKQYFLDHPERFLLEPGAHGSQTDEELHEALIVAFPDGYESVYHLGCRLVKGWDGRFQRHWTNMSTKVNGEKIVIAEFCCW